jgi:hypothetical protein
MEEVPDWPDNPPLNGRALHVLINQEKTEPGHPWKGVSLEQWNNWKWQLSHRIFTFDKLKDVIHVTKSEKESIRLCWHRFPMTITPYFSALLDCNASRGKMNCL